jgi:hypothetical protein
MADNDKDDDTDDDTGEDPGLAVVRHVADKSTVRSIKQTLLTALLVRIVQRPRFVPRRVKWIATTTVVTIVLVPVLGHGDLAEVVANLI